MNKSTFASLGLCEAIVRAVSERGYTHPTPIQAQAIPAVLSGGDLLAGAQTGTGKTAGFTLPILQLMMNRPVKHAVERGPKPIRVLVLAPTRELAAQVEESVREYGKHLKISSAAVFGGVNMNPQVEKFRKGVDILVATPGRLLDHVQQKTVNLSHVEILVLDEADRMLDMGFIHDIKRVLALLPKKVGNLPRQNLLFSATFPNEIKTLADNLLNKPALIEIERHKTTAELVDQKVMLVHQGAKRHLLAHLIKEHSWFQVLVFTRTKHGANRLAQQLDKQGITSLAIHGNKSQNARTRALAEFKNGKLQVLVATDIAARGLDIEQLPHVVNFELPNVPEDYVHRIGRTGRAGASGEALSLVSSDEMDYLRDIEKLIKRTIPRQPLPGFVIPAVEDEPHRPQHVQRHHKKPNGERSRPQKSGHGDKINHEKVHHGQKSRHPEKQHHGHTQHKRSGQDDQQTKTVYEKKQSTHQHQQKSQAATQTPQHHHAKPYSAKPASRKTEHQHRGQGAALLSSSSVNPSRSSAKQQYSHKKSDTTQKQVKHSGKR